MRQTVKRRTVEQRAVRLWLFVIAALLIVMILLGGTVRLTDSGLSITEWHPITGVLPPLSAAAWQEAFLVYRAIPQYEALHPMMTLSEFKVIYWWEWSHRFFARFIGLVFLLPFLFFLWRGWLSRSESFQLLALFVLGGLQGLIGWFMVQSGLSERIDVAPLLLALHLGLAMLIYAWVVLLLLQDDMIRRVDRHMLQSFIGALIASAVGLVFIQLLLGAMLSGLDGGLIHNHWLWPSGADLKPSLDNPVFWQALHRLGGWLLFLLALVLLWKARCFETILFAAMVGVQLALGLLTLIYAVPLFLGLLHQLGAIACWTAALLLLLTKIEVKS